MFCMFSSSLACCARCLESQTSAGVGLGHGSRGTDRAQDRCGGGGHDRWGQLGHQVSQGGERTFALTRAGGLDGVCLVHERQF